MTKNAIILEDRGIIAVGGSERRSFLQGLITNDIELVTNNNAIYAALLTPQGKYMFDFFIVEHGDLLLMDVQRARLPDLLKRLMMYRLRADVALEDESDKWMVAALLGPVDGLPAEAGACMAWNDGAAFTDPRTGALGTRVILPAENASVVLSDLGLEIAAQDVYDAQRIGLGIPDHHDMVIDKTLALEANLDVLNGVSFKKGCYVGALSIAAMSDGNSIRYKSRARCLHRRPRYFWATK
ncbi:MAG: hypothetical protein O2910_04370 [Proteobacteria bacterium]|nr:hypothetical protein [Pseudomonadota bacterium]